MYGLCCCCLELPCLKSLWSEYDWMGQHEVYGDMLNQCFNLSWSQQDQTNNQICEVCITLLRNAVQFKERVIHSQRKLTEKHLENIKTNVDKEFVFNWNKNLVCSGDDDGNIGFDDDEICDDMDVTGDRAKNEKTRMTKVANEKRMALKKRKREIQKISKEDNNRKSLEIRKINYIKPRQNACLLLEHSTMVPFKSSRGYFTCFYCNKQHIGFDELKSHMSQFHENVNFKNILKSITRPHDRIKADVSDITCKICKKSIDDLETLVSHLTDHKVKFNPDDAVKPMDSILPYDLSENKFKCYICKSEFLFFKTLSNHMNAHSSDYVCDICGRCFLLSERLRAHIQMHLNSKSVKCDICSKVCSSNFALKSHIRYMHKKLSFICSICNETFATYRLRMKHLEVIHKRTPLNLNCKICFKKYNTPNSLNNHMRSEHLKTSKEPKHSCDICGMRFKSLNALSCHLIVHSGEKKYQCEVCHKRYARAKTLTEHLKIHRNDRRWTCGVCARAFVQKCSLRNHIRVHHGDMDLEQLIIYKKPDS